jgi:2-polyprenyl-6-methoxyphenol hydroxylase-like FAD-dependent oxidoreductase
MTGIKKAPVRRALVIGGGIAGPVAASALCKAGIEPVVYEAYERTADGIGGVVMIAPNGLDALRIIGVEEAVRDIGQPISRMVIADGRGRKLAEMDGVPGLPPSQVMWRSELYRVLHDHAEARGVRTEYGKRLVGAEETPDGVTARFADGSTATGDVLIGADGIRSTVRTLIDPGAPGPEHVVLLGFGGYADHVADGGRTDAMTFANGKRAFFGYWTHPDGDRTLWFSNLPHGEAVTRAQAMETSSEDWLRRLREAHADDVPARDVLRRSSADELFVFGSMEAMPRVPHWHRGRMVLIGDSAHAPSSSSGQGVALAAESAIQLARCLRDAEDIPTAFATYERLRRPRVEKVAADAAKTNSDKAAGPVARTLMRALAPLAMKTFMKPEKMFGPLHGYRIDWDEVVAAS